jgi:hypothetical protein
MLCRNTKAYALSTQVLTGDGWGDIARGLFIGSGNPGLVGIFFASYHIIVVMVLVNVVIAVLLDEFSKAVRSDREAATARGADDCRNRPPPERRCPFERVARELSSYFSLEFLDQTIASHWRKVVAGARGLTPVQTPPPTPSGGGGLSDADASCPDDSESLSFKELSAGLRALTYLPPVLFRQQHWEELVVLAGLCDGEGQINARGFSCLLKQALWRFLLGEMSLAMDVGGCKEWDGRSVRAVFLNLKGALSLEYGAAGDDDVAAAEVAEMAEMEEMEEMAEAAWHRACSLMDPPLDPGEAVVPAAALGVAKADHGRAAELQDLIDGLGALHQRFADLERQLAGRSHDDSCLPLAHPEDSLGPEGALDSLPSLPSIIPQAVSGIGIAAHTAARQQELPVLSRETTLFKSTTTGAVLQTPEDLTLQIGSGRLGHVVLTPQETPGPSARGCGSPFPKGDAVAAMVSADPL